MDNESKGSLTRYDSLKIVHTCISSPKQIQTCPKYLSQTDVMTMQNVIRQPQWSSLGYSTKNRFVGVNFNAGI
jgi:hypothetical protein